MLTDKPFAFTPDGAGFGPKFFTAPGPEDEFELALEDVDPGAPVEDVSLRAVVGEPELAAPPEPSDDETLGDLRSARLGPDGFERMDTVAGVFDAKLFDKRPAAPLGDLELSPTAGRELAPANDGAGLDAGSVDLSSTLNAIRAFLGGMNLTGTGDRFSFASLVGGEELAPGDDSPLDPFRDAIDPAWVGEIMATLLPDGSVLLPDGTISLGSPTDTPQDPMVDTPLDGPDGWVV